MASDGITKRGKLAHFAATQIHSIHFLVQAEFYWVESSSLVRAIAKWLILRHSATAPEVVLGSEDWLVDLRHSKIKANLPHRGPPWAVLGMAPPPLRDRALFDESQIFALTLSNW